MVMVNQSPYAVAGNFQTRKMVSFIPPFVYNVSEAGHQAVHESHSPSGNTGRCSETANWTMHLH